MLNWIFGGALFLTVYTYLLFPILLFLITKLKRTEAEEIQRQECRPNVAMICSVFNEEKVIRKKIDNFLSIKYDGHLRLYIGSDGSTDGTNNIIREFEDNERIFFFEFPRRGKVYVINDLMARVHEDFVVFTDANSMFEPDAVIKLLKGFTSSHIGVVCGRLKLVSAGRITGEGFYWKYETAIKKKESLLNCVIGANGAIYAIRNELLKPLPINVINDDFTNSMRVVEKGYGIKYAEDAVACEEVNQDDKVEFRRHIRDGAGHYRAIINLWGLLNPFKPKAFFLYVSHRLLRWLVPFFLIIMLCLPPFMKMGPVLETIYAAELVFYLLAILAWLTKTKKSLMYYPYYLVYVNLALFVGFLKNILGLQKVTWISTER